MKKNIVMLKSNWYLWKESITFEKEKKHNNFFGGGETKQEERKRRGKKYQHTQNINNILKSINI